VHTDRKRYEHTRRFRRCKGCGYRFITAQTDGSEQITEPMKYACVAPPKISGTFKGCPACGGQTRVSNTEINATGLRIRRFRNCPSCGYKFRTTQTVEKLDNDGRIWHFAKTRCGELNGRNIFTEDDVRRMRRMYETKEYSQKQLAKIFGTGQTNVSNIVRRATWAWVK
jgi:transcriptional regulator NrdR family protein